MANIGRDAYPHTHHMYLRSDLVGAIDVEGNFTHHVQQQKDTHKSKYRTHPMHLKRLRIHHTTRTFAVILLKSSMLKGISASRASAIRCSTKFVEPPSAHTTT